MATFGKDTGIFEQIAGGNLQALRDLVVSTTRTVQQPMPSTGLPNEGNVASSGNVGGSSSFVTIEKAG
jgi:hypothetical protein